MLDHDRVAVAFGRVLRGAGLAAPVGSVRAFAEALDAVGLQQRASVYWAGMATLVRRPEDRPVYDRAFRVFWQQLSATNEPEQVEVPVTLAVDVAEEDEAGAPDDGTADDTDDDALTLRFSTVEVLRDKDFADYTDEELAEAQRWMQQLALTTARRRSRRLTRSHRPRGHPDLRATVREAMHSDGELIRRRYRRHSTRPRRLVLLVDISGSMEPYARALLRFIHAAVVGRRDVEAFTLGTRLTRLTRELSTRDPDHALRAATESVRDWSGGTRLGEGLAEFNDRWGVRGMARGATVVVLSDGWDRGEPEVLAEQMARLQRVAHRVVWVNPLKVTPGYAPLARGMAAALPYVDDFVEGHSLDALQRLADLLGE